MRYFSWPAALARFARRRWLVSLLTVVACSSLIPFGLRTILASSHHPGSDPAGEQAAVAATSVSNVPTVPVIQPHQRNILRIVGQPSFVESYERTSIYPKVAGYVEKWNVDIGDRVKKGDVLAIIYAPEVREDWETKKHKVELDREQVALDEQLVQVAHADVEAADARLTESRAILAQYQAAVERWDVQVKRLRREVERGIVDPQVLLETENQWKSSIASRDAAKATILKASAELLSKQATEKEDTIAVRVARADLSVAQSDARRQEAWVNYLTLTSPYNGVVVARNANTGDFVLPRTGDASADQNAPHLSPNGSAAPLYVIDRTDVVRIFVDIPEGDANYVHPGTRAEVHVQAFRDEWIPATVTRTSWALNVKSRTLRAEIDLRNIDRPDAYHDEGLHPIAEVPVQQGIQLLPGMYAYVKVDLDRPNVWALPDSALVHIGEKTYYWGYENGHASKVEVQTGITDGQWVEVTNRQSAPPASGKPSWTPINGSELVVGGGDLSGLAEGGPVHRAESLARASRGS